MKSPAHQAQVEIDAPVVDWPSDFPTVDAMQLLAERALGALADLDQLIVADAQGRVPTFGVTLVILDDARMAEINFEQRGKDQPTDVLSFPSFDFPPGPGTSELANASDELFEILNAWPVPGDAPLYHVGDIVISYETCVRQAAEIGHGVIDEFQRLLVHGLLHLFGYDHETSAADETRMRAREDLLLEALD